MRPYDAKHERGACKLERSVKEVAGDFWILTDGYHVTIAEQPIGSEPTQAIRVPRASFNKLVDWYMREQSQRDQGVVSSPLRKE